MYVLGANREIIGWVYVWFRALVSGYWSLVAGCSSQDGARLEA
jgi:hypothetical protein